MIAQLIENMDRWGIARNITYQGGANTTSQASKAMEEFAELIVACAEYELLAVEDGPDFLDEERVQIADAIGDIVVCLVQVARLADVTFEDCLEQAWAEIKDRKGTMVNGKFVKE